MELNEYKKQLAFDNRDFINIYFADWTTPDLFGVSTFPWDPNAHTQLGTSPSLAIPTPRTIWYMYVTFPRLQLLFVSGSTSMSWFLMCTTSVCMAACRWHRAEAAELRPSGHDQQPGSRAGPRTRLVAHVPGCRWHVLQRSVSRGRAVAGAGRSLLGHEPHQ